VFKQGTAVGSGGHTYTGHGARPGWKRAGPRDCWQCICRRRPCAGPHSRWRGRASGASPRLQWGKRGKVAENRMKNATQ